jgi:hypothetical protein
MCAANAIWQGDANARAIQCLAPVLDLVEEEIDRASLSLVRFGVHGGDGRFEGAITAQASLDQGGGKDGEPADREPRRWGFALESHHDIDEKFGDSGESALKAVVEKEIEKGIVVASVP